MKIAIILGAFSAGNRPLDPTNLMQSDRGLTGTELCLKEISEILLDRDNDVQVFTVFTGNGIDNWNTIDKLNTIDDSYDAVISINEPNLLIGLPKKCYKVVYMMLNDFSFVKPGYDDFVDSYVGVCQEHTEYMMKSSPSPHKWSTVNLGCNPERYEDKRIPGRVVYASSPDRGLHFLLQAWPDIVAAVPNATLKIFYHFNFDNIDIEQHSISPQGIPYSHHTIEVANRMRYIKSVLPKLKHLGVEHVGGVSRLRIEKEFSEASVFAFPCSTVSFSEGFSCTTLESLASYSVSCITDEDCLGSIYKDSGAIITATPIFENIKQFTDNVIKGLTDKDFAKAIIRAGRVFAKEHTWRRTAIELEQLIRREINDRK